jgi:hypothetical protein
VLGLKHGSVSKHTNAARLQRFIYAIHLNNFVLKLPLSHSYKLIWSNIKAFVIRHGSAELLKSSTTRISDIA